MSITGVRRFTSENADEIEELWKKFVPTARLLQVDESHCHLDWFSVAAEGFSIVKYQMTASVVSAIEPADQLFTCRVTTETGGCEAGRDSLSRELPWASTGQPIRATWKDSAVVHAIAFDREYATILARQISGDDTLSVTVKSPEAVSDAAGRQWDRTLAYLAASYLAEKSEQEGNALLDAGLQRHALWTLLTTFPTTFTDALRRPAQTSAAPQTVRRALSYIDSHAHEPITVDDVARAVHISTRGLQYAFRRALTFTPSEYLRMARLAGAHEELRRATPTTTITSVAQRWGFTNAARFASHYRQEYGEHPRDVLKRTVG